MALETPDLQQRRHALATLYSDASQAAAHLLWKRVTLPAPYKQLFLDELRRLHPRRGTVGLDRDAGFGQQVLHGARAGTMIVS